LEEQMDALGPNAAKLLEEANRGFRGDDATGVRGILERHPELK